MNRDDYLRTCETIYDMSDDQRNCLLNQLQSRVWKYRHGYAGELERLYELDSSSIQAVLREVPLKLLALALKGASDALLHRFSRNMPKAEAAGLEFEMNVLGPLPVSKVERFQADLLEIVRRIGLTGGVELPPSGEGILAKLDAGRGPSASRRMQGITLLLLSDQDWKQFIVKTRPGDWAACLWYTCDHRLAEKVLSFGNPHYVTVLIAEFNSRWSDVKCDSATDEQIASGRRGLDEVMRAFHELTCFGMISVPE